MTSPTRDDRRPRRGLRTSQAHVQPTREHRLEELKLELAARFQPICRDMSGEDFAKLVDEMARFRLKYDDLEAELAKKRQGSGAATKRRLD